jgi:hypothetical protein
VRTTSSLVGASLMLALTACGTIDTHTDSNPRLASEMARWRTYAWLPAPEGGDPMIDNDIVRARVQDAVDRDLARFGFRVDNANPDFLVGWTAGIEERVDVDWGSTHYGYGWGGWYDDYAPMYVDEYAEGTLILDFVDADRNELGWRGVAEGRLRDSGPDMPTAPEIKEAVHEILEEFPLRAQP